MAFSLPRPFGKYLLLRRIAVGGMAEIYQAKSLGAEGFQKDVVIKLILPSFSEDEAFVTMFIDEARIAARLHHQNIVQIFDFDRFEDCYYIAMEYVEGRDLRKVMDRALKTGKRMPPLLAVHAAAEIAAGLRYAHTRKGEDGKPLDIIHRDVSPHNILVSFLGEVKITDFGIAKAAARSTKTRAGTVKGKCAYMSPEQARGKPLDPRSDMFAVCAITWEMLTGRRPFEGDSDFEILNNVLNASLPPPSLFAPGCPRELDAIVLKGLRKDREERYPDMAAIEKDLRGFEFKHASDMDELSLAPWMQELFADDIGAEAEAPPVVATPRPTPSPPRAPTPSPVAYTPAPATPSKADGTLLLTEEVERAAASAAAELETVKVDAPSKPPKTVPVGMLRQELEEMLAAQTAPRATGATEDQVVPVGDDGEVPTMALSGDEVKDALAAAVQRTGEREVGGSTGRIRIGTGSRPVARVRRTALWVSMAVILVAAAGSAAYFVHAMSDDPAAVTGTSGQAAGAPDASVAKPADVAAAVPDAAVATAPDTAPEAAPIKVAPPPAKVAIDFEVTPGSATVKVEGETVAAVGGRRSLAGKYMVGDEVTITARAPGYKDYLARVTLRKESETVRVKMDPSAPRPAVVLDTGYVNLNAKPWADVFFRGRKLGTTPLRGIEVPVGRQTFMFRKDVATRSITIVIEKGRTVTPAVVEM
jgi:serine/threonine-protein kinase